MLAPTPSEIRAARANTERLEAIVPRVECCWCGTEMGEGAGPTSHGVCRTCEPLQGEPLYPWRVHDLALDMAAAYGRWDMSDERSTALWEQAKTRYTKAHNAMVEDMEREIRRLRVAAGEIENPDTRANSRRGITSTPERG